MRKSEIGSGSSTSSGSSSYLSPATRTGVLVTIFISQNEALAEKVSYTFDKTSFSLNKLTKQIGKLLNLRRPRRLFLSDGKEITSMSQIIENSIVFCSQGEPYFQLSTEILRLSVLGSGGVGKSALTLRFIRNLFVSSWDPTIEDAYRKAVRVDDMISTIEILDTAGQEDFSTMRTQWMTNKDGYVIVYSVVDIESVKYLQSYVDLLEQVCREGHLVPPIIFIGNKTDLLNNTGAPEIRAAVQREIANLIEICQISITKVNDLFDARHIDSISKTSLILPSYRRIRHVEVSAFTGDGIQEAFFALVREIRKQKHLKAFLDDELDKLSWPRCVIM